MHANDLGCEGTTNLRKQIHDQGRIPTTNAETAPGANRDGRGAGGVVAAGGDRRGLRTGCGSRASLGGWGRGGGWVGGHVWAMGCLGFKGGEKT
jgi:hypothetical protein